MSWIDQKDLRILRRPGQDRPLFNQLLLYAFSTFSMIGLLGGGLFGCSDPAPIAPPSPSPESSSRPQLAQIQGALRLPQGQECFLFQAVDAESDELYFEIEIEQARIRNHQYSFLHELEPGEHNLKGILLCEEDEYQSLNARFHLEADEIESVDFRFFFDVESDLAQVDLLFCAELFLSQLSPFPEACPDEEIQVTYDLEWLRDDCGEIFFAGQFNDHDPSSTPFSFPQEQIYLTLQAPSNEGFFDLSFFLHTQRGDRLELSVFPLEVIACGDQSSASEDPEDETEVPEEVGECIEEDQMTRTPWQMHRGNEQGGPEGFEDVIPFETRFTRHGGRDEFDFADIPEPNDQNNGGWTASADPQMIQYNIRSRLCPESANIACRYGLDFTYFQSFINLPNLSVEEEIKVDLRGIDDGALIVIFNDLHPQGLWVEESHVALGNRKTMNLVHFMEPGFNRVVIIHVDDCCGGSYLRSAQIELNQQQVDATECDAP